MRFIKLYGFHQMFSLRQWRMIFSCRYTREFWLVLKN